MCFHDMLFHFDVMVYFWIISGVFSSALAVFYCFSIILYVKLVIIQRYSYGWNSFVKSEGYALHTYMYFLFFYI